MAKEGLRHTPLHEEHKNLGARLVDFAGYEMPVQYSGIQAEHDAVRNHAGLFDVSHMGEAIFRGPDAESAVQRLVTRDVGRLDVGQAGTRLIENDSPDGCARRLRARCGRKERGECKAQVAWKKSKHTNE